MHIDASRTNTLQMEERQKQAPMEAQLARTFCDVLEEQYQFSLKSSSKGIAPTVTSKSSKSSTSKLDESLISFIRQNIIGHLEPFCGLFGSRAMMMATGNVSTQLSHARKGSNGDDPV